MLARPAITRTAGDLRPGNVSDRRRSAMSAIGDLRPGYPHTRGTARPRKADNFAAADGCCGAIVRVVGRCFGRCCAVAVVPDLPAYSLISPYSLRSKYCRLLRGDLLES
jgi:hypothetical protein